MYKVFLASKSPRRKELLSQIGIEFEILVSDRKEIITSNEPDEVVKELSMQKAYEIERMLLESTNGEIFQSYRTQGYDGVIIIGADTVVSKDGIIMGKPDSEEDALNMLKRLQGGSHMVSTGVTMVVYRDNDKKVFNFAEDTEVYMYEASDDELKEYIATGEPMDKAGSYGIHITLLNIILPAIKTVLPSNSSKLFFISML